MTKIHLTLYVEGPDLSFSFIIKVNSFIKIFTQRNDFWYLTHNFLLFQRQRLLRQLKVVTKRAFAQILEKRPECTIEFENVKKLDNDLFTAIESVRKGRQGLLEARKKFTGYSFSDF